MSGDSTPQPSPPWTFASRTAAPASMLLMEVANDIARTFGNEKLADTLNVQIFSTLGVLTVEELSKVDKGLLMEALKHTSLSEQWALNLKRICFANPLEDFPITLSRSVSALSDMSGRSSEVSTKSADSMSSGGNHISQATKAIGGALEWRRFAFPHPTLTQLQVALNGPKFDDTGAMHTLFKFNLATFESEYVDTAQKMQYAALLHKINNSVSVSGYYSSVGMSFSNRRGGRFKELNFNPQDVNDYIMQYSQTPPMAGKIGTSNDVPALYDYTTNPKLADKNEKIKSCMLEAPAEPVNIAGNAPRSASCNANRVSH